MKLKPLGKNVNVLELSDGTEVLFSYKTPVAAFIPGEGYCRTDCRWSITTSKHINKWIGFTSGGERAQSFFDNLANRA